MKSKFENKSANAKLKIADDVSITKKMHDELLKYLIKRLDFGNEIRDAVVDRFSNIDQEFNGFITLDVQDAKRLTDIRQGKVKTVDINLELASAHIEEVLTYLLSVFAPDNGMYSAVSTKEKQAVANAFVKKLNEQAAFFGHYRELNKFLGDALKYNLGGLFVEWEIIKGKVAKPNQTGEVNFENGIVQEGNKIKSLDMYNTIWDISQNPIDVAEKGEFFAIVDIVTPFELTKDLALQNIFNVDVEEIKHMSNSGAGELASYYKSPPIINSNQNPEINRIDFRHVLTAGRTDATVSGKHEKISIYIWINPSEFGLSSDNEYEIWQFDILNADRIIFAQRMTNTFSMLPCAFTIPRESGMQLSVKSYAEQLIPLQRFASNEFNIHQRSARKRLYGLTIYNSQAIPLMEQADVLGGKIPWKPSGIDQDIRKAVLQLNDSPQTNNTLQNVEAVVSLMEKYMPTQMANQIASLERAVQYQVAALVQSGERKNFKLAKLIDDQALTKVRFMMMANIITFLQEFDIIKDQTGEEFSASPARFVDAGIEFTVSHGLKGLERVILVEGMKDVLTMVLQSSEAQQRIDIVAFIDHITSFMGDKSDFDQYRFKSEFDRLTPQEKEIAFQLLQQAAQQKQQQSNGQAPAQLPSS